MRLSPNQSAYMRTDKMTGRFNTFIWIEKQVQLTFPNNENHGMDN